MTLIEELGVQIIRKKPWFGIFILKNGPLSS
jgi:hypothetical protein